MRKCNQECIAVCDFCKHYNFNGEDLLDNDGNLITKKALYVGNGFCSYHSQKKEPHDFCSDFYCRNIESKEK